MLNMTIGYELLHAFFWINIGALLYLVDRGRRGGESPLESPGLPTSLELGSATR
jgi:hypothetical protein